MGGNWRGWEGGEGGSEFEVGLGEKNLE